MQSVTISVIYKMRLIRKPASTSARTYCVYTLRVSIKTIHKMMVRGKIRKRKAAFMTSMIFGERVMLGVLLAYLMI